ncbi:hypothetical protein JCGZ_25526 [Jatropha curcas]|uniref:HTH myb-type domain-containing protein n=1 Tax=Jatropha curcas TaxID=180498 RepID=A0A067JX82_JATCU|nr:myb family transcription factor PHL5 isoform X2 [Jatropha curcas]KDP24610.1 hypothetical protein JCGZ_25526 [Jatropha curcas]
MNTSKIDFQERVQQNHGVISDFALNSLQCFDSQQNWKMGVPILTQVMEEEQQQHQDFRHDKSSTSIMSRFESPASAFYATEKYMGFPLYDCQVGAYSKSYDSQFTSQNSLVQNYPISSMEQRSDHSLESRNSLLSIYKGPCSTGNKLHQLERNKLLNNGAAIHLSIPFHGDQDYRIGCNPCSSPFGQMGFPLQREIQSSRLTSRNPVATGAVLSSKTRIRWTQDLHEKFVECVNRLGGAEKATPKAILKLMDTDGLTIFHVKSHLQKYRIAKYLPDPSEGKAEKRTSINEVPQIDARTGLQITEALQLQLDVQRRLHEQLEIQKNLQLRIEEQGRQLQRMFDQQQRKNQTLFNTQNSDPNSPDESEFSLDDFEVSIAEGSNSTHFKSKIS